MLGAALAEAKQVAWRAASAEASGVGARGEVSCLVSGGGELQVERSLWRIVREAEIEREEREGLREK